MWVESLFHCIEDLPCDKSNTVALLLKHPKMGTHIPLRHDMFKVDSAGDVVIEIDIEGVLDEIQRAAERSAE